MYVPSTRKIISLYDVVFDESFSSALAYKSQPYSKSMAMHPEVTYTPCATSLSKQTSNKITFTQFEYGNVLTKTRNDADISDKYKYNSIIPPVLIEEEMYAMNSGDDSDNDIITK